MKIRRSSVFCAICTLFLLIPSYFSAQSATLSNIRGKVEVKLAGADWLAASEGMVLPPLTQVSTGINSTAQVAIGASTVFLQSLTRLTLEEITEQAGGDRTSLNLNTGRISAQVRSTEGRSITFEVRSPIATASVRGTDFEFDGVQLEVIEGSVAVVNRNNQEVVVTQGGQTTASNSAPPKPVAEAQQEQTITQVSTLPPPPAPPAPPSAGAGAGPGSGGGSGSPPPVVTPPATATVRVNVKVPTGQ